MGAQAGRGFYVVAGLLVVFGIFGSGGDALTYRLGPAPVVVPFVCLVLAAWCVLLGNAKRRRSRSA